MKKIRRICPVCASQLKKRLGQVNQIELLKCDQCKARVADCGEPTPDFYEEHYIQPNNSFGYDLSYIQECKSQAEVQPHRRINTISSFSQSLEIGAGIGCLQYKLKQLSIPSIGIERSEYIRKCGKEFLDVDLLSNVSQSLPKIDKSKDTCIVMIEVIEHISNPKEFLDDILTALQFKPKSFYFTTPNGSAMGLLGTQWKQVNPPDHVILHTSRSLQHLMRNLGYTKTKITHYESVLLHFSKKCLGRRSNKKMPIMWIFTAFLAFFDIPICRMLPSCFSLGLEVLAINES